jgi:hypothetical protein
MALGLCSGRGVVALLCVELWRWESDTGRGVQSRRSRRHRARHGPGPSGCPGQSARPPGASKGAFCRRVGGSSGDPGERRVGDKKVGNFN